MYHMDLALAVFHGDKVLPSFTLGTVELRPAVAKTGHKGEACVVVLYE